LFLPPAQSGLPSHRVGPTALSAAPALRQGPQTGGESCVGLHHRWSGGRLWLCGIWYSLTRQAACSLEHIQGCKGHLPDPALSYGLLRLKKRYWGLASATQVPSLGAGGGYPMCSGLPLQQPFLKGIMSKACPCLVSVKSQMYLGPGHPCAPQ
jgi:hypothetical protein